MAPPTVRLTQEPLADATAPVVATAVRTADGRLEAGPAGALLLERLGIDLALATESASSAGDAGEITEVPVTAAGEDVRRVLLVGAGDGGPHAARRSGAALARRVTGQERLATDTVAGLDADAARAHLEGLLLAAYSFRAPGARLAAAKAPVSTVELHLPRGAGKAVTTGLGTAEVTARAVHVTRDLANMPSNVKTPEWLALQAHDLGRRSGLAVTIRDERALAAEGFQGILAVGAASARPPRLVELAYRPDRVSRRGPHVVLVGKGITFDTGGLSLKPREPMIPMKTDMAAGGAVIAVMAALRDAGVRVRVTGLVPLAENMPGAGALRPGDVITHYGGRTVEVLNTDAEGRLVLADALAYADATLEPDVLVDLATLTGAASLGLGRRHGALYSADESLAEALIAAGEESGDRLWRMPLVEDYRPYLDSDIADLTNVVRDPHVSGGSITAALFLREFVGSRRWAHIDIAGPARAERDEHEVSKGGTGFGARLLLRWLEGLS